jgi:fructokinase
MKDASGCGDWTSAGIISRICNRRVEDLKNISEQTLISGLKYGQALAAWNCGFEGARGGRY